MKTDGAKRLRVHIADPAAGPELYAFLWRRLKRQPDFARRELIALCIGSDRYTGDALGPLVGSYLTQQADCRVFGTLDHPVHAGSLADTVRAIDHVCSRPLIIAVDACLGQEGEIGSIEAWEGALQAGIAVGNHLPSAGHLAIAGVVNVNGPTGYLELQRTPLSTVMRLSRLIGRVLAAVSHVTARKYGRT